MEHIINDLRNAYDIASDEDINKFKVTDPKNGMRVEWYYIEDKEYAEQYQEKPRNIAPYSGILALAPDKDTGRHFDFDDFVVIIDRYPTEKCSPISDWVALPKILSNKDLVEVF